MKSLIAKAIGVWLSPMASMKSIKEEGDGAGIKSSLIFILAMGLISGLITAILGQIFPPPDIGAAVPQAFTWLSIVIVPLVSVIGSFIGAAILWGFIIFGLLKGSLAQYKTTYRLLALLAAFSPVSALLSPIPGIGQWLALAINVWATIVMIRGIILVMDTSPIRTWITCVIIFGALFLLGITARFAAQQQLAGGGFPGAAGDLNFDLDEDELNAELEALAEEARNEGAGN